MNGIYLYLMIFIVIFVFLLFKIIAKRKGEKQAYEEREDNVFYDSVKKIRRDWANTTELIQRSIESFLIPDYSSS